LNQAGPVGSPGLHRGLGRFDATLLTINSVVGAGVLALPAGLALDAGRWSLAVVLVAFVVIGFMALSLAEVASRFEVTGGPQVYAQIAFGPLTGFAIGWLFTVSRFASFALIAQVMFDYAAVLWPALEDPWARNVGITLYALVFMVLNLRGVRHTASVGNLLTLVKMLPLALIALAGLWFAGWNNLPASEPRAPDGIASAMQLALFACFGFDVASILAGEMRDPRRDLPVSILAGLGICCLLYLLLMLACFGVLADTSASELPLADVARTFLGPVGATVMAATAVVSCIAGNLVQLLVTPRNIYALAEAGDLPPAFMAVHRAWRTPHVAIVVNTVLAWLLAITGTFQYLLAIFVIARMLSHGSTAAALIALRRRDGPAPLPIPGGVVISVLAIAACVAIVMTASWQAVRDVLIVLAVGLAVRAAVRSLRVGSRVSASPD
jgi:amino acid transporter